METEDLISIETFCIHYNVEPSFLHALSEQGLIEIIVIEPEKYIHNERIGEIEQMMRLHYELAINLEGIEAVVHLLRQVEDLQEEVRELRKRLRGYEGS